VTAPLDAVDGGLKVDGAAPVGPALSPFTVVGGDAELCEGDACALPSAPAEVTSRGSAATEDPSGA
jgi:hypothetical protein